MNVAYYRCHYGWRTMTDPDAQTVDNPVDDDPGQPDQSPDAFEEPADTDPEHALPPDVSDTFEDLEVNPGEDDTTDLDGEPVVAEEPPPVEVEIPRDPENVSQPEEPVIGGGSA